MTENNSEKKEQPAQENHAGEDKKKQNRSMFGKLKKVKHIELILAGVAVLVMLIIFFSSGASCASSGASARPSPPANETRQQRLERQLSESFSKIEGAGETIVIINWESNLEATARQFNNQNQSSINSNQAIYPRALGVLILTQGGDNVRLKLELINAVSVFLDITPDRIRILNLAS